MADLRNDPLFKSSFKGLREAISSLNNDNIQDAITLYQRGQGWNNLQAHSYCVIPVALYFSQRVPSILCEIQQRTNINRPMGPYSLEARDQELWRRVQDAFSIFLDEYGDDIVTETKKTRSPRTCRRVAHTYLSVLYSGSQTRGGAGNTVLKRTLKLLAHLHLRN